jgi:hypothetical protein
VGEKIGMCFRIKVSMSACMAKSVTTRLSDWKPLYSIGLWRTAGVGSSVAKQSRHNLKLTFKLTPKLVAAAMQPMLTSAPSSFSPSLPLRN